MLKVIKFLLIQKWLSIYSACITEYYYSKKTYIFWQKTVQCESKNPPSGTWHFSFFHKWLRIFTRFFRHLLYVPSDARLQIFIQLSPTLMKLCHINHDYPVHIICSKCPPSAETHAFRHLRKSLIALLIVVCGKSL